MSMSLRGYVTYVDFINHQQNVGLRGAIIQIPVLFI